MEGNFDIEDFVELKSVSTYGWRVDLERIRSKYFVDMMRPKGDEPLDKHGKRLSEIEEVEDIMPQRGSNLTFKMPSKGKQLLEQIQQIKVEGGRDPSKKDTISGGPSVAKTSSTISLNKPPLGKGPLSDESLMASIKGMNKDHRYQKGNSQIKSPYKKGNAQMPPRPLDHAHRFKTLHKHQKSSPAPGQYEPKYSAIFGRPYQNVIVSKGDRFICKDVFQTWLNKSQVADNNRHRFRATVGSGSFIQGSFGGNESSPNQNMTMEWAAQEDILNQNISGGGDVAAAGATEHFRSQTMMQNETSGIENNRASASKIPTIQTSCNRYRRTQSRGQSPSMQSAGQRTPQTSYLNFDKQVPRKDASSYSRSPHESRFDNFTPFTPTQMNQFHFENQAQRPDFVKPTYVSVGGFSYHHENAMEKFRFGTIMKKALPFKREPIDYAMAREHLDMKALMKKRRKERSIVRSRQEISRQGDEKWCFQ